MPESFKSTDIFWIVEATPQKIKVGYLYSNNNGIGSDGPQWVFFKITLTCHHKKGPWPQHNDFEKTNINWDDENVHSKTKADKTGTLSQDATPGKFFSIVMKSVAYGPSNYRQLNESMKLVNAKNAAL